MGSGDDGCHDKQESEERYGSGCWKGESMQTCSSHPQRRVTFGYDFSTVILSFLSYLFLPKIATNLGREASGESCQDTRFCSHRDWAVNVYLAHWVVLHKQAVTGDFDGSGAVDFADFLEFATAFGQSAVGDNARFDLDGRSGSVEFGDFLVFAAAFGQSSADEGDPPREDPV